MAKVAFHKVTKRFDNHTLALRDFSLDIADGELMVLVGPSGCGKSTALRLLAGLESVSNGEILIDGQVVNRISPQQRNIAMVFQNYALYPHMTVRGNLEFPLRMRQHTTQAIANQVEHIAAILDLTGLLDRKPKQLSGGQRQRVAMGRALVRDPSVFLLDEPLSNLDARLRAQIRADIARLQKRLNKTTLYVTHDQVEAMTLGDRVAVMQGGELQQVGTPQALYNRPQNTFVARFIGSPGMNIVSSTLQNAGDNRISVQLGKQNIPLSVEKHPAGTTLSAYLDRPVYLGIRPEAIRTTPLNKATALTLTVQSVEFLGHESLVYFQWPGSDQPSTDETGVARMAGQCPYAGKAEQPFYLDPEALYLFDETGRLIE